MPLKKGKSQKEMTWREWMKTREGGLMVGVAIIGIVTIVGYVATYFKGDDNAIEEIAETHIEDYVEEQLGLPENALKDQIDLTPWSDEDEATRTVHQTKPGIFEQ